MTHFSKLPPLPETLTSEQIQILNGTLLGDAAFELNGKNPRMKIDRAIKDKAYLEWQFSFFKDFCGDGIKELKRWDDRYGKFNEQVSFRTRAVPLFLPFHERFYPASGKKIVPEDIELTPLTLASWFCDDGCVVQDKSHLVLKLSTESFGEKGAQFLADKLEKKFEGKFPIFRKKKGKDQFFIKASDIGTLRLIKEIEPLVKSMGMTRKSDVWAGRNLDYIPIIGKPSPKLPKLYAMFLEKKDLLPTEEIAEEIGYLNLSALKSSLNDLMKKNFLERYEGTEKFNLYHYRLTSKGQEYFQSQLTNTRFL